jgi:hypothetical protein
MSECIVERESLIVAKGKSYAYATAVGTQAGMTDTKVINLLILEPLDGQRLGEKRYVKAKLIGLPMQVAACDKLGLSTDENRIQLALACDKCARSNDLPIPPYNQASRPAIAEQAITSSDIEELCPVDGCDGTLKITERPRIFVKFNTDEFRGKYLIINVTHNNDDHGTPWPRAYIQGGVSPEEAERLETLRTGKEPVAERSTAQVGATEVPVSDHEPTESLGNGDNED